jgi:hypothetical protein
MAGIKSALISYPVELRFKLREASDRVPLPRNGLKLFHRKMRTFLSALPRAVQETRLYGNPALPCKIPMSYKMSFHSFFVMADSFFCSAAGFGAVPYFLKLSRLD